MDHDHFLAVVELYASLDRDTAKRATAATLATLGERIAKGEARDLAAELPPELAPLVATHGPAERFDLDEFIRRVAEGEGVDLATAERHASAVFVALSRSVSEEEWDDMVAELPMPEFTTLLPRGPAPT
jgi:uncharacterized protein (DUF2267 family)